MRSALKWLLALPLLAALVIPVVGWQLETRRMQRGWSQATARNRDKPIPVRTVAVVERDGLDVVGATCVSQPSVATTLVCISYNAEMTAKTVSKVNYKIGDAVNKGDVILEFERAICEQAARRTEADVRMHREQISNIKKLIPEGAASQLELAIAESELESANLMQELAVKNLEECKVQAPFDGVIHDLTLAPGAQLTNTQEICTIYQLDPLMVKVEFPIERLDAISEGDRMRVTFDSFPDETHTGKVVSISPLAKSQTRVLEVYVEVPNPDDRLKGGITGYARLQRQKRAVTIPRTAVIQRKGKSAVFKVVDGEARIVEIRTGALLADGELELLEGLRQGDEIVVFGQDTLVDGAKVNADWLRWANRIQDEPAAAEGSGDDEFSQPRPPLEASPAELQKDEDGDPPQVETLADDR